jgi:hypothetical protein
MARVHAIAWALFSFTDPPVLRDESSPRLCAIVLASYLRRRCEAEGKPMTSRRDFLSNTTLLVAATAASAFIPARSLGAAGRNHLTNLTAVQAVAAMRSGDIKAEDYAREQKNSSTSMRFAHLTGRRYWNRPEWPTDGMRPAKSWVHCTVFPCL